MSLSKKQLLLIHNVLFQFCSIDQAVDPDVTDSVRDVLEAVENELLSASTCDVPCKRKLRQAEMAVCSHEEVYELDDHEEQVPSDSEIDTDSILDLEEIKAFDVDQKQRVKLHFFRVNNSLGVDLFNDKNHSDAIENILWISRSGSELFIGVDESTHTCKVFSVSKFPKSWTSTLETNVKYHIV